MTAPPSLALTHFSVIAMPVAPDREPVPFPEAPRCGVQRERGSILPCDRLATTAFYVMVNESLDAIAVKAVGSRRLAVLMTCDLHRIGEEEQ